MTIIVQVSSTATSESYSPDILNWVMPDVPMAPLPLVVNAIRDAAIELCERALIWRQELQQILVLGPTSTTLAGDADAGATGVVIADDTNFASGDTVTIALDDGTKWRGHTTDVPGDDTFGLDGPLPSAAAEGNAVVKLVYLYPITVPSGTAFAKGLKAWLNDVPIDPISQDDLDTEFNNTDFGWIGTNWRTDINLPTRFYFPDDKTVGLALAPNATGNLRILAALKPSRASTTLPQWIWERYVETIAHGAKAKIMLIPKKPYSQKETGAYHLGAFNGGIGEAMISAARSRTRAPLRSHTVFALR